MKNYTTNSFKRSRQRVLRYVVAIFMLWGVMPYSGYAQGREEILEIYFGQDIHKVEENTGDNKEVLEHLAELLDKITTDSLSIINKIEIKSWTSPEPGVMYNEKLSERRSNSIRDYILERWEVQDSILVPIGCGIAWDKLTQLVEASDMPYRDEILNILNNVPEETWKRVNPTDRWLTLVDSREKHLMDLRGGKPYKYLYDNIYPELRYGSQILIHYDKVLPLAIAEKTFETSSVAIPEKTEINLPDLTERVPIIALKTNLLFDAVTALNVEVELPIKDKYSIMAEWTFPWWVTNDNGYALEVLSGSVEGRYWLGDRTNKPKLTGWFGGLYGGGGLYDLQWNNNGYQGEFFIAAGLSAGYAHTLNKSETLRMEYSLGIGYLSTDYRYYEGKQDNEFLVWQYDGKYSWLGPTKAKISLVWMLHRTKTKKGGKR